MYGQGENNIIKVAFVAETLRNEYVRSAWQSMRSLPIESTKARLLDKEQTQINGQLVPTKSPDNQLLNVNYSTYKNQ